MEEWENQSMPRSQERPAKSNDITIIVGGTRTFSDFRMLSDRLDGWTAEYDKVVVVTGACPTGADALAERWAFENRFGVLRFHPDWEKHGKSAGPMRTLEMLKDSGATRAYVFWDGKSPGSKYLIEQARKRGLKVRVVRYDKGE